jgi:N-acetyl sugar amidotransferase
MIMRLGQNIFGENRVKKVCTRCVMDDVGDPLIRFEPDGTCNYCNYALKRRESIYFPNEKGHRRLNNMLGYVKKNGKNKEYDCIMGISGGLDSAYLAYLGAKKWGLRILGVHVDDGFDAPIATQNINNLCNNCGIELITITPDKEQYMDLTRSFLLAGLPGICIPQDAVLVAALFQFAQKKKIRFFLSGTNFALESVLQRGNMHTADLVHIKAIQKQFGDTSIDNLPLISLFERYIGFKYFQRQKYIRPLDWIEYTRDKALEELGGIGFSYYGAKHYESILTKFLQVYYLPNKFNIDIRKSHLSSLIVSGQITRDEALSELKKPLYDEILIEKDIDFILENLNLSREKFNMIMDESPKKHMDYEYSKWIKFAGVARKLRKALSD